LSPTRFVRTWSAKTTLSGYGITKLRLSERRTGEQGCFLWRTPGAEDPKLWATPKASDAVTGTTARTSGRSPEKTTHLAAQVHLCPTPRAADGEKGQRTQEGAEKEANRGHGIDLPLFVQLFPTPTVCGNYNRKGSSAKSGDGLATAVKMFPTPTVNDSKNDNPPSQKAENGRRSDELNVAAGGALNPAWMEWLMGFLNGWTDIETEVPVHQADPADLEWWSVEPEIPRVARGIPNRVARLRALGNAVVPMQAFPIFRAIAATETTL
jgi:hypothetical protein